MFWIQVVVVTAVVFVIAAVVLGAGGTMPDAHRDRPDLDLPADRALSSGDVEVLRFPVVLRGYRMSEVDNALDRIGAELAARDARIMELEYRLATPVAAGAGSDTQAQGMAPGPETPHPTHTVQAANAPATEAPPATDAHPQAPTAAPDPDPAERPAAPPAQESAPKSAPESDDGDPA